MPKYVAGMGPLWAPVNAGMKSKKHSTCRIFPVMEFFGVILALPSSCSLFYLGSPKQLSEVHAGRTWLDWTKVHACLGPRGRRHYPESSAPPPSRGKRDRHSFQQGWLSFSSGSIAPNIPETVARRIRFGRYSG